MTTSIDTKALTAVVAALARVGTDATYVQYTAEIYNPATLATTEGTATNTTLKIIPPYRNSDGFTLSTTIKENSFFASEALLTGVAGNALATEPKIGDEIVHGSDRFKVVEIEPIRSGDDIALYLLRIDEIRGV